MQRGIVLILNGAKFGVEVSASDANVWIKMRKGAPRSRILRPW
jgi:hypothetical protein